MLTLANAEPLAAQRASWSHVDAIIAHLTSDGSVTLQPVEQEILTRVTFADELIRECKWSTPHIRRLLMQRFNISRETAARDIADAENIFSSSTPLNKQYRIAIRIERVEHNIRLAEEADDLGTVAKLEAVLAKYLEMYPETKPSKRPQVILFDVPASVTEEVMDLGEAELVAKQAIADANQNH